MCVCVHTRVYTYKYYMYQIKQLSQDMYSDFLDSKLTLITTGNKDYFIPYIISKSTGVPY